MLKLRAVISGALELAKYVCRHTAHSYCLLTESVSFDKAAMSCEYTYKAICDMNYDLNKTSQSVRSLSEQCCARADTIMAMCELQKRECAELNAKLADLDALSSKEHVIISDLLALIYSDSPLVMSGLCMCSKLSQQSTLIV